MPLGDERDDVIVALVDNLLYTANQEKVSAEHQKLASHWALEIQDNAKRGAAKRKVFQRDRGAERTVQELEKQFVFKI